ncbi:aminodeoxychorismate synthase component I [Gordonia sp. 852002-50816_SCH5313054-c]|uniref:aminodeoxychorismate synthase component I n=1 Tax=unclassified Gordonia (in: high G+C Gram-positive bacteria) TaxID=2657482 RepID=UPI0007E9C744|nr:MULTISPECIES: aminodeoxychorismate synthase component I [unclassified Gordonia (in: high G+C Gram-positive bacteria)]OBC11254.1 aminodeoxychorismate synthase component I [Gordonia sp. 852002-50816_SCH5313054-c]OBC14521.1 aminodeoxychorismate synthase component I [Gordonia sp. 852002-50816_SCH5313054-a]
MTPTATDLLRTLQVATARRGSPPPAALVGDWWDADAVIAPSIEVRPGLAPPDRPDRFWLGYLGFPVRGVESALPTIAGGETDHLLVLKDGRWQHVSASGTGPPDWVREVLADAATEVDDSTRGWSTRWEPPDPRPHLAAIEHCLEAISAGEIYQACLCTRFTGTLTGSACGFFADLVSRTRPAKSAFLQGDWGAVASFSPETFLSRRGERVWSAPIKGTIAAGDDPTVLAASSKDIAENIMIVDLVRNDLGRVACTGSVRVERLLEVVGAPGVWHLVSRVGAQLPPEIGNVALLDATFPPASVTGTPKLRAMQLLADWERDPRGVYCGAVGLAGPGGLLDLNVAIRTVEIAPDGSMALGVGGGITADSDPHREWQECLDKAASVVNARPSVLG